MIKSEGMVERVRRAVENGGDGQDEGWDLQDVNAHLLVVSDHLGEHLTIRLD